MSTGRKLSRRKLAGYVADQIESGKGEAAIKKAAAYMIETKQKDAVDLLVRDIEEILAGSGTFVANLTSAHRLSESEKESIAKLLGAKRLHARETIDPGVLGGVKIEAAGRRLDATLKRRIDSLKEIGPRKGTT